MKVQITIILITLVLFNCKEDFIDDEEEIVFFSQGSSPSTGVDLSFNNYREMVLVPSGRHILTNTDNNSETLDNTLSEFNIRKYELTVTLQPSTS